jgi:hypothetical protein
MFKSDLEVAFNEVVKPYEQTFVWAWDMYESALEKFVKEQLTGVDGFESEYEDAEEVVDYMDVIDPDPTRPWKIDVLRHIIEMAFYEQKIR